MIKDLAQVNAELQEQKERVDNVDFKMVTFSLAGKDYGVDIMNVKEIAKADKFTFVPNAASFVRGVYNLRGDIIPIIDLRAFFHLPVEKKLDGMENMLILRIQDQVYGTIVDKIDKVVGIASDSIQPPHPIFGDINIKFISGVVEKQGDLYIILDVLRIFSQSEEDDKQKPRGAIVGGGDAFYAASAEAVPAQPIGQTAREVDNSLGFIKESLAALTGFYASSVNESWLRSRFTQWSTTRSGDDLQLKNASEADEFLQGFYSPCTASFWDEEYASLVRNTLPDISSGSIQVWNLGCGKGYETFSFACILRQRYPGLQVKIWANDSDIMAISQAPNMTFAAEEVPQYCKAFMTQGPNGFSFNQVIKDSIVFEYHDILNDNPLPSLDIILARDMLSYLAIPNQDRIIASFQEKLKSRGLVILGRNETITNDGWQPIGRDPVSIFAYS